MAGSVGCETLGIICGVNLTNGCITSGSQEEMGRRNYLSAQIKP
jgi:hypothetical protein